MDNTSLQDVHTHRKCYLIIVGVFGWFFRGATITSACLQPQWLNNFIFVKSKYVAQIISLTWFISTHSFIIWNWTKAVRKNEFWYKHILTVEISYQPFKFKKYFLGVLVAQSSVMSRKFREIYMLEFLFIRTKTPFLLFLGESFLSLYIRKQVVIK